VRLVQQKDDVAMAKAAKNHKTSKGKFNEQGQRLGKDGKFYNQTRLAVEQVYEASEAKSSARPSAKDGKASKASKGPNLNDIATETLLAILKDSDGQIAKAKLPVKIQTKLGSKHPQREDLRKLIFSDEFLEREEGWTYDRKSKSQLIELAEAE
jgi:hypothetical protein